MSTYAERKGKKNGRVRKINKYHKFFLNKCLLTNYKPQMEKY